MTDWFDADQVGKLRRPVPDSLICSEHSGKFIPFGSSGDSFRLQNRCAILKKSQLSTGEFDTVLHNDRFSMKCCPKGSRNGVVLKIL